MDDEAPLAADATRSQTPALDLAVLRVPPDLVLRDLITNTREDVP